MGFLFNNLSPPISRQKPNDKIIILEDLDGDGKDDVLVGAPYDDIDAVDSGTTYIVYGGVTGTIDLSIADARLIGLGSANYAGIAVGHAGDVDNDGYDDILVGATHNDAGDTDLIGHGAPPWDPVHRGSR